jgi:hypothetical protein
VDSRQITPADSTNVIRKTDSLGTGCHEEIVTPITDSDTMNFVSSDLFKVVE